jgi:hypothetical protein
MGRGRGRERTEKRMDVGDEERLVWREEVEVWDALGVLGEISEVIGKRVRRMWAWWERAVRK